jgi:hypothetical protein
MFNRLETSVRIRIVEVLFNDVQVIFALLFYRRTVFDDEILEVKCYGLLNGLPPLFLF